MTDTEELSEKAKARGMRIKPYNQHSMTIEVQRVANALKFANRLLSEIYEFPSKWKEGRIHLAKTINLAYCELNTLSQTIQTYRAEYRKACDEWGEIDGDWSDCIAVNDGLKRRNRSLRLQLAEARQILARKPSGYRFDRADLELCLSKNIATPEMEKEEDEAEAEYLFELREHEEFEEDRQVLRALGFGKDRQKVDSKVKMTGEGGGEGEDEGEQLTEVDTMSEEESLTEEDGPVTKKIKATE